jgi:hypothetical protein
MALCYLRRRAELRADAVDPWQAWPFPSLAALELASSSAPDFCKQRHRTEIASRRIWSPVVHWLLCLVSYPMSIAQWCLASPIVLLVQCLPIALPQSLSLNFGDRP